jgi:hypothetical protein
MSCLISYAVEVFRGNCHSQVIKTSALRLVHETLSVQRYVDFSMKTEPVCGVVKLVLYSGSSRFESRLEQRLT